MFVAILWFSVLALFLVWSVSAWVLHAFVVWSMNSFGTLSGHVPSVDALTLPPSLMLWIPPEMMSVFTSTAAMAWPFIEIGLSMLPAIAGWLTPLTWVVWGIGSLVLLAIAAVLHAMIFAAQKATRK